MLSECVGEYGRTKKPNWNLLKQQPRKNRIEARIFVWLVQFRFFFFWKNSTPFPTIMQWQYKTHKRTHCILFYYLFVSIFFFHYSSTACVFGSFQWIKTRESVFFFPQSISVLTYFFVVVACLFVWFELLLVFSFSNTPTETSSNNKAKKN